MKPIQHILIRLPNWLGDMVMSTAFVKAVQLQYPGAVIDVIAKKGIDFLLDYFPNHNERFIFDKEVYSGLNGAYKFGKEIKKQIKYDLFFCLPDSLSSAIMGYGISANKRVGYKKEGRSILLTSSFKKKENLHRVEEYVDLLQQFTNTVIPIPAVELILKNTTKKNALIVNINSEASSRRLPLQKAVSLINNLSSQIEEHIILVGSNKEKAFVDEVFNALENKNNMSNEAGNTTLPQLLQLFASCSVMLTTDSGPAHVANALGTHTIVLFGAGNEHNTAPYNKINRNIIRLGQLPCEPCVSNVCKLYGVPECLLRLDENNIVQTVKDVLKNKN